MMSSTNYEDPFLQVQADVHSQLSTTRSLFTSYLRIRSLASTSGTSGPLSSSSSSSTANPSPELVSARADLESSLSTLADDLADLLASVHAASRDPSRYGLSPSELLRRKDFIDDVSSEIDSMREDLHRQLDFAPSGAGHSSGVANEYGHEADPLSADNDNGDTYEAFEQQQQVRMMQEQDEQLEDVFQTVGSLRQQADSMGRELEEQAEMLEEVDTLAGRVGDRLQTGIQKVGWVMRRNEDTMSSCCIGLLILVLVILLIVVLFI